MVRERWQIKDHQVKALVAGQQLAQTVKHLALFKW
jgi:hypothetical protein